MDMNHLKTSLFHSKMALFAIVGFLTLVTVLIVIVARVSNEQALSNQSSAYFRQERNMGYGTNKLPARSAVVRTEEMPAKVAQQTSGKCDPTACKSVTNGFGECLDVSVAGCNKLGGLAKRCELKEGVKICSELGDGVGSTCCVRGWSWSNVPDICNGLRDYTLCTKAGTTGAVDCKWDFDTKKCKVAEPTNSPQVINSEEFNLAF